MAIIDHQHGFEDRIPHPHEGRGLTWRVILGCLVLLWASAALFVLRIV